LSFDLRRFFGPFLNLSRAWARAASYRMISNDTPPGIYEASEFDVVFVGGHTMTAHKDATAELGLRPGQRVGIETLVDVTRFNLAQSEAMNAIKKAQEAARRR
jgi:hypothetical protein